MMTLLKSAGMLIGVLLVAATATVIFGLPGDQEQSDTFVSNGLLAASRDQLAVCVHAAAGASVDADDARTRVQAALTDVTKHPLWSGAETGPPAVDIGCPSEPYLLQPGVSYGGKPIGDPSVQAVETVSPYRVFLFVLPPAELSKIFGDAGGSPIRVEPQEFLCEGDVCAEVTTGLYLSPEELADPVFLGGWLEKALGLEPLVPEEKLPVDPGQR